MSVQISFYLTLLTMLIILEAIELHVIYLVHKKLKSVIQENEFSDHNHILK